MNGSIETNKIKSEIGKSRTDFKVEIEKSRADFKVEIEKNRTDFKVEIEKNRTEIEKNKAELLKWMFIFWIGQIGVISGIMFAMLKLFFR